MRSPPNERGRAMGINPIAAIAGSFVGLIARRHPGRLGLARWCSGSTCPSASSARSGPTASCTSSASASRRGSTGSGNITFAVGLILLLIGITYGIQPYGGHTMGWTSPWVLELPHRRRRAARGVLLRSRPTSHDPMFNLRLFRIRAVHRRQRRRAAASSIGRGGLQFMLIIWLQGIWLPLHGYSFESTPLWAGIYMMPAHDRVPRRRRRSPASSRTGTAPARSRRAACCSARPRFLLPDAAARQLQLLGLRRAALPERRRHRACSWRRTPPPS